MNMNYAKFLFSKFGFIVTFEVMCIFEMNQSVKNVKTTLADRIYPFQI